MPGGAGLANETEFYVIVVGDDMAVAELESTFKRGQFAL